MLVFLMLVLHDTIRLGAPQFRNYLTLYPFMMRNIDFFSYLYIFSFSLQRLLFAYQMSSALSVYLFAFYHDLV